MTTDRKQNFSFLSNRVSVCTWIYVHGLQSTLLQSFLPFYLLSRFIYYSMIAIKRERIFIEDTCSIKSRFDNIIEERNAIFHADGKSRWSGISMDLFRQLGRVEMFPALSGLPLVTDGFPYRTYCARWSRAITTDYVRNRTNCSYRRHRTSGDCVTFGA